MKSAKEMFKELGFKYEKYNKGFAYEKYDDNSIRYVHFDSSEQIYRTNIYYVEIKLHDAITTQLKELGWI